MTRALATTASLLLLLGAAAAGGRSSESAATGPTEQIRVLLDEARFDEAEKLARDLVRATGTISIEHAQALDLLVEALLGAGKAINEETEDLAHQAVANKQRLPEMSSAELGASLANLGRLYIDRGEPAMAKSHLEQALALQEADYGLEHPALIRTLRNLGNALNDLGELEAAEVAYRREGLLIATHRGPDHIDVAANSYNTARLLINLGDFVEAERLFNRARGVVERTQGEKSPRMVWVLIGLGQVLDFQGDHARAITTHERALEIARATLGPEHPLVGSCETGLGAALMHLGDFRDSYDALQRALALTERTYGAEHENTGRTLKSLAEAAYELGDIAAAETYLKRAKQIFEQAGADYLLIDARVLAARNLAERGALDEAIPALQSALSTGEELIPNHPDLAIWGVTLGEALLDAGRPEDAAAALLPATRRAEHLGGVDHRAYLAGLTGLATARARAGDTASAFRLAVRAEELSTSRARFFVASLPERQALRAAEKRPSNASLLLTLAAVSGDVEITRQAWNLVIGRRAAVLDELAFRQRLRSEGELDPELVAEYTAASRRLANLLVRGASGNARQFTELVASAKARREQAGKRLAVASSTYRRLAEGREIGFDRAIAMLPEDSALVALVLYQHDLEVDARLRRGARKDGAASEESRYAALVATGSEEVPRFVPLGTADEIETAVAEWRQAIHEGLVRPDNLAETAFRSVAERLRQLVWDAVAVKTGAANRIFVVPDGRLHLVNLATLPSGDTGYLVDRFSFHYLSAERELAPAPSRIDEKGLLALGGVDYQDPTLFAALRQPPIQIAGVEVAADENGQNPALRGGPAACPAFEDVVFPQLPGASSEAQAVVSRWSDIAEGQLGPARLLSGRAASEARFKAEAPGRRILHVATHGFFLEGECQAADVGQRGIGGLAKSAGQGVELVPAARTESPLKLSGLALAGANHRASAAPDEEDGILTAQEIAAMDLSGVEWAVLSGCDTGLGEIRAGEGVFGLRRAFRAAGVQTLIMSLWPVRDDATVAWMVALYEARLEDAVDTMTAVTAATRAVLQSRRGENATTHPALWGGFVASGEWR